MGTLAGDSEELNRVCFDRCVRSGVFTLEALAGTTDTEQLAEILLCDVDRAVSVIYAARAALEEIQSFRLDPTNDMPADESEATSADEEASVETPDVAEDANLDEVEG